MSEVGYTLKAYRDDHIGHIHEREVARDDDHLAAAKNENGLW